jgi:yecA family protein
MTDIPSIIPDFSAEDAERLKAFLAAPERPQGMMGYYALNGFLFTVCCAPEPIQVSEWMPLVFADQEASYATLEEAREVLQSLMALYNHINRQIRETQAALPEGCTPDVEALANLEPKRP